MSGRRRYRQASRRPGLLLAFAVLALVACGTGSEGGEASCQRIVALSPGAVETLYALGLGDRVVGVGSYTSWPPEALELPRLGGLIDPNFETIVGLQPDLAVLIPSERSLGERLARLGVQHLEIPNESIDDLLGAMERIGEVCGFGDEARRQSERFVTELAPRPIPGSPRVLITLSRQVGRLDQILAAGPGTFLDELLTRLGAVNVLADAPTLYPQVGLEEIVRDSPEVIVELHTEDLGDEEIEALRLDWRSFAPDLPLAQARVAVITGSHTMIPGPRLPRLYGEIETALRGAAKAAGSDG